MCVLAQESTIRWFESTRNWQTPAHRIHCRSTAGTDSLSATCRVCNFDNSCYLGWHHDPDTIRLILLVHVVTVWSFLCHLAICHLAIVSWLFVICHVFFPLGFVYVFLCIPLSFLAVCLSFIFHLNKQPITQTRTMCLWKNCGLISPTVRWKSSHPVWNSSVFVSTICITKKRLLKEEAGGPFFQFAGCSLCW